MKREEMAAAVRQDLEHIARGPKGSPQNMFRMTYTQIRRRDLSNDQDAPRSTSLGQAIESIRRQYSDLEPEYDREYFGM